MLNTEVIYKVRNKDDSNSYAYSPDGIGMIWHDTLAEAKEQCGLTDTVQIGWKRLERLREGD